MSQDDGACRTCTGKSVTRSPLTATLSSTMSFTVRRLSDAEKRERSFFSKPAAIVGALALRPVVSLLLRAKEKRQEEQKEQEERERVNLLKRLLIILLAILAAFLLFAGATKAMMALQLLDIRRLVSVAGADLPKDAYGHINLLLLGQGDDSHSGVDLTDTIMLASIDPGNDGSVAMLSIPRDLYMTQTERMGIGRVNGLYRDFKSYLMHREGLEEATASRQAMRELADELGRKLDTDIHGVVKIDFIGFKQAVDAVGGIDIVVPEDLYDNQYPGPNYSYVTFSVQAGPQHFDGETALKYARSRHSTSDFDRSHRQQLILQALAEKMSSDGLLSKPNHILSLLKIVSANMETTFSARELLSLASVGEELDRSRLISLQLNASSGDASHLVAPGGFLYPPPREQFGGAAVLLPASLGATDPWDNIRTLTAFLTRERDAYLESAPITVLNAGAPSGSAGRLAAELTRYGFHVLDTENAEGDLPASSVTSYGSSPTALLLSSLLHLPLSELPPPEETGTGAALPLVIRLGEDYSFRRIPPSAPSLHDAEADHR